MQVDTHSARQSIGGGKDTDFTVGFLKEQLKFMTDKQRKTSEELEEKEALIQKLEHEKREMQRQCESMDVENIKMAEKLKELLNLQMNTSTVSNKTKKGASLYCTPKVSKQQNRRVLEEDGIVCFDLDKQSLLNGQDLNADEFDLRESIAISTRSIMSRNNNSTMMRAQAPPIN